MYWGKKVQSNFVANGNFLRYLVWFCPFSAMYNSGYAMAVWSGSNWMSLCQYILTCIWKTVKIPCWAVCSIVAPNKSERTSSVDSKTNAWSFRWTTSIVIFQALTQKISQVLFEDQRFFMSRRPSRVILGCVLAKLSSSCANSASYPLLGRFLFFTIVDVIEKVLACIFSFVFR